MLFVQAVGQISIGLEPLDDKMVMFVGVSDLSFIKASDLPQFDIYFCQQFLDVLASDTADLDSIRRRGGISISEQVGLIPDLNHFVSVEVRLELQLLKDLDD